MRDGATYYQPYVYENNYLRAGQLTRLNPQHRLWAFVNQNMIDAFNMLRSAGQIRKAMRGKGWWLVPAYVVNAINKTAGVCTIAGFAIPERNPALDGGEEGLESSSESVRASAAPPPPCTRTRIQPGVA